MDEFINKIIQGDCLEVMKEIPDGFVDMVLCDLPYGTTACSWDTIIPFEPLWAQYLRVGKKNCAFVFTASQPFTTHLIMSNIKMFKYIIYWNKNRPTGFVNCKKQPLRCIEDVVFFYEKSVKYNPQNLKYNPVVSKNSKTTGGESLRNDVKKSKNKGSLRTPGKSFISEFSNYPTNLIRFDGSDDLLHPTQKPVKLFKYLIETYFNPNDIILDNCIGSGTTALAAIKANRKFIGIELNQEYINITNKRINDELKQGDFFRADFYE